MEELDTIGEYYLDRSKGVLYLYPQLPIKSFELSMLTEPMVILLGASNVKFQNITFECSRGIGVYMEHTNNNRIENCEFRNLGVNAVCMGKEIGAFAKTFYYQPLNKTNNEYDNDGGKNNGIINCTIYNMGAGGVLLGGGNRLSLIRAGNFIENCTMHDVNRIEKTYRAAVSICGVGNRISHCKIYNTPSQAILLVGNDHLIEYNDIYHVLLEVDDGGAIYCGNDPSERGNVVRFNYFHEVNNEFRTMGVYIDDGGGAV
ncbi:MAG: right-handed parallel beta-helix repeat-containing protein [Bacteroidota bacterium]|nr:right-handed parallel beta-helix repeat-containing protein [Bacteroidota bacterium]